MLPTAEIPSASVEAQPGKISVVERPLTIGRADLASVEKPLCSGQLRVLLPLGGELDLDGRIGRSGDRDVTDQFLDLDLLDAPLVPAEHVEAHDAVLREHGLGVGEPAACRWFLNWFDETPRDEMRRLLLAEVNRNLAERQTGAGNEAAGNEETEAA